MRKPLRSFHVGTILSGVIVAGFLGLASSAAQAIPVSPAPAAVAPVAPAVVASASDRGDG